MQEDTRHSSSPHICVITLVLFSPTLNLFILKEFYFTDILIDLTLFWFVKIYKLSSIH